MNGGTMSEERKSGRPDKRSSSARPSSSGRPSSDSRPGRGGRTDRPGATRDVRAGREASDPRGFRPPPIERDQSRVRPRIFEPDIPDDITGEELEKSVRAELLSLSAENAKVVARHLACINLYMDVDPELAHKHGVAAAHHAGRLAVVRESAGYAAYRAGHYEIALKELRASHRISGDVSMWPVLADCERGLGKPLKALALAGSPEVSRLAKAEEIEMRIVASGARRDLGEFDAAVITLTCKELKVKNEPWSIRLHYAYADALASAGRADEARQWFSSCADLDEDVSTDAYERARQ